jgi:hypothetical protein
MKWKTLAVLVLVALAGCGGGDDNDDSSDNGTGGAAAPADTTGANEAPKSEPIKGKVTEEKLIKASALEKKGDHYVWSDGCEVQAVAVGKDGVKKLQETAKNPKNVIANKNATAAVEIIQATYPCAVHASLFLRTVP